MDGIVFYRSFYEAIIDLDREQQLNVYNAIMEFTFKNKEISLKGIEKTIFTLIKPQLQASINNYVNGKKGGRPKKENNDNIINEYSAKKEYPYMEGNIEVLNRETIRLPNGTIKYIDEKRYGGNGSKIISKYNGCCAKCGSDKNIVIHHKNGYSNDIEDLIVLCKSCHGKEHSFHNNITINNTDIEKDIELDIKKEINKDNDGKPSNKPTKFIKPTLQEIKDYCLERKNNVNAEKFINYYESNGWKVGKNSMKCWKACIRTWETNNTETKPTAIINSLARI